MKTRKDKFLRLTWNFVYFSMISIRQQSFCVSKIFNQFFYKLHFVLARMEILACVNYASITQAKFTDVVFTVKWKLFMNTIHLNRHSVIFVVIIHATDWNRHEISTFPRKQPYKSQALNYKTWIIKIHQPKQK